MSDSSVVRVLVQWMHWYLRGGLRRASHNSPGGIFETIGVLKREGIVDGPAAELAEQNALLAEADCSPKVIAKLTDDAMDAASANVIDRYRQDAPLVVAFGTALVTGLAQITPPRVAAAVAAVAIVAGTARVTVRAFRHVPLTVALNVAGLVELCLVIAVTRTAQPEGAVIATALGSVFFLVTNFVLAVEMTALFVAIDANLVACRDSALRAVNRTGGIGGVVYLVSIRLAGCRELVPNIVALLVVAVFIATVRATIVFYPRLMRDLPSRKD